VGASKHGANMETNRTRKKQPGAIKPQVNTGAPPGT
jgi:hypothetical protein